MILISHRGNLEGKTNVENHPKRIDDVIKFGFDVEIDLRFSDNALFLGHDEPQYKIDLDWLLERKNNLWVHCKDLISVEYLVNSKSKSELNFFFHDIDLCTITSKGYIWVLPGHQPIKSSISVMPEINKEEIFQCIGICSDFIKSYK